MSPSKQPAARKTDLVPDDAETLRFIDEMALLYEKAGHTRMQGRIVAWLMICDPPHQTASQIGAALHASKASISTNIRMFVDFGLVERYTRPPDRRDYYRLLPDMWPQAMERSLPLLRAFADAAERGRGLVAGHGPDCRQRIDDMREFFVFYEDGVRILLEQWRSGGG